MRINKSPWIHQLDKDREAVSLKEDIDTDIAIVGAGIAGISTAFFILRYTNQRVVLLDQSKMAHGATGHNAGQVVCRLERPLEEIVEEFGFEKTRESLQGLYSAWSLIDEMHEEIEGKIHLSKTTDSRGLANIHQVLLVFNEIETEMLSGLPQSEFLIDKKAPFIDLIPSTMKHLYKLVSQKEILEKLNTESKEFYAVVIKPAICMNSALFCQEIVKFLLKKYKNRISLYEDTRIRKIVLKDKNALLDAGKHTIDTHKVILCTNGFENLDILNEGGLAIDKEFHHLVTGKVGYMSGYIEKKNKPAVAVTYLSDDSDPSQDDPYFYLTRRPHGEGDKKHNLVCVGGPEIAIEDRQEYLNDYDYPEQMQGDIDDFVKNIYDPDPNKKIDYEFTWHGLMGYTPNRVRLIGEEPKNRNLLYNLGCNGIGIIPSVYGGKRIAKIIAGERLQESIFDPRG